MTQFNPQQLEAINHNEGACLVVAAAGSGKSSTLVARIENLVKTHKVPQSEILSISFTRESANDLKKKLSALGLDHVNVGTFHSICGRILAQEGYQLNGKLILEWQAKNVFREIDKKANVANILSSISFQKNFNRMPNDEFVPFEAPLSDTELREYYKAYEDYKKKYKLYDFDDYLLEAEKIMRENPKKYSYKYVLVDEHQDSNIVQNTLIKHWSREDNVYVTGDGFQALYQFRGSDPSLFMNFEKEWDNVKIINMNTNYRSTQEIVERADKFIHPYFPDYKHAKYAVAHREEKGSVRRFTSSDQFQESIKVVDDIEKIISEGAKHDDIAVLYRNNAQSSFVENELKSREIPYEIKNDSSFFKKKEIDGILSILRLISNEKDDDAMENVFNLRADPLKFFSNRVLDGVRTYAGQHNLSTFEALTEYSYPQFWMKDKAFEFVTGIKRLSTQHHNGVGVVELITNVCKTFNIYGWIKERYEDETEVESRIGGISALKSFVKGHNLESFINYAYSEGTTSKKRNRKNTVTLVTIHGSKGLEWEYTYLIGNEEGRFPHEKAPIVDESCIFYVGTTRGKTHLVVSEIGTGNSFVDEYFRD